jgi:hypothetical protein
MGKLLATVTHVDAGSTEQPPAPGGGRADSLVTGGAETKTTPRSAAESGDDVDVIDDSDMVVIEEDFCETAGDPPSPVVSVRPNDYRSLFTRLRRARG